VLGVVIGTPPMNLIGPELVRDLVRLLSALAGGPEDASRADHARP
jgi:hypothetical protein